MQRQIAIMCAIVLNGSVLCGVGAAQDLALADTADHPAVPVASRVDAASSAAPVHVEAPRARVQIGFNTVAGAPRYAQRSGADGTATTVRFVATRASAGTGSYGGLPTGLPVTGARLTSAYGTRVHPISGHAASHHGVDLAVPSGTPVVATSDGVVEIASWWGGYGLMVALDHGGGSETRYAHLSSLAVRPGESVSRGQVIGRSGSTGNSTGPHLHYEVRQDGRSIDPL